MRILCQAAKETLLQVNRLLDVCGHEHYNTVSPYSSSHIGRHTRHILDHFVAVKSSVGKGSINYNIRSRDSCIEVDLSEAKRLVEYFINWLDVTDMADVSLTVKTEVMLSDSYSMSLKSTLSRELAYLISHTVHHLAYSCLLAKQIGLTVDSDIGIAPATASFLRQAG